MTFPPKTVILDICSLHPAQRRFSSSFDFIIPKFLDNVLQLTAEIMKVKQRTQDSQRKTHI